MAFTRKKLKTYGLTDEQIEQVIEDHTEVVNGLKDAHQTELENAKKSNEGQEDYKAKFEALQVEFNDYKTAESKKQTAEQKKAAYTALLKEIGLPEKLLAGAVKVADLDKVTIEGSGLKDAETLKETLKTEWADFIPSTENHGTDTPKPAGNDGGNPTDLGSLSMDDYIKARTQK